VSNLLQASAASKTISTWEPAETTGQSCWGTQQYQDLPAMEKAPGVAPAMDPPQLE